MALSDLNTVERNEAGIATVLGILKQRFGERFQTGQSIREQHAHTTTYIPTQAPDGVVFPESTEEVQEIVRACAEHRVPVIAFGAGTSLEGHVNAPGGGISLDTSRMNRIVEVNPEDLDCTVEPGVTREELNDYLRDTGLFFPIDPGANASLGGMASTRASGTNAVRYGTMRDNVLSLTAVMADGSVVTTGKRAKKSSAGYDLTRLLIGSEGTLGIITSLTLKLSGIPQAISGGVCPFPSVEQACEAVIATIQMGIPVARIELVNALQMRALNNYSKLDYPEGPCLFVEFHGSDAGVAEQAEVVRRDRRRVWRRAVPLDQRRRGADEALEGAARRLLGVADAAARRARAVDRCLRADLAARRMHRRDRGRHRRDRADRADRRPCRRRQFPHAGADGYQRSQGDRTGGGVRRAAQRAGAAHGRHLHRRARHRAGQDRLHRSRRSAHGVDVMRTIKAALDPDNILNPGKIWPMG